MKNKKDNEEKKLEKEADQYQHNGFFSKIPFSVKALLIKYWFFGALCFFVFMGTGYSVSNNTNLLLIGGLISGAINDIACYNILNVIDKDGKSKNFIFFRKEKAWYSIPINVLYHLVLFFAFAYSVYYFKIWTGTEQSWFLREPLTQGLLLLGYDMLIITIKNLIVKLFKILKKDKVEKE